jgi:hypothetical protein
MRAHTRESIGEAFAADGFQQIVDRIDLECLNGVPIVRSDEYHARHVFRADLAYHVESVHLRHLYVQKDEIRTLPAYQAHGLLAVLRLQDEVIGSMLGEQHAHGAARQRLIVHDQRFH